MNVMMILKLKMNERVLHLAKSLLNMKKSENQDNENRSSISK